MKKINIINLRLAILTVFSLFLFTNCNKNERQIKTYDLPGFEHIINNTFADVHIGKSTTQTVKIEAPEIISKNIIMEVSDNKLHIHYRKPLPPFYAPTDIYINIPTLKTYCINGSGNMKIENLFDSCKTILLEINGSGNIDALMNVCDFTTILINGSGNTNIRGRCPSQQIYIYGSGNVDALSFETKVADVIITGSGNCKVNADSTLKAYISGSGNIIYKGNPEIKSTIIGSGDIRQLH